MRLRCKVCWVSDHALQRHMHAMQYRTHACTWGGQRVQTYACILQVSILQGSPPYTRPMPLLTISSPSALALSRYTGLLPADAPQNTAILLNRLAVGCPMSPWASATAELHEAILRGTGRDLLPGQTQGSKRASPRSPHCATSSCRSGVRMQKLSRSKR